MIHRVHQEDFCQALRVHPSLKYQNEGGPGPKQIVDLLRANVSDTVASNVDIATFLDALILNWLIGGTDAHGKNYSILIGAGGLVRLAPLYDIASILAYSDIDPQKAKLAMKIGDEYRLRDIGISEWRKLAADVRVDGDALVGRARAMAAQLPDCLADEVRKTARCRAFARRDRTLADVLPSRAKTDRAGLSFSADPIDWVIGTSDRRRHAPHEDPHHRAVRHRAPDHPGRHALSSASPRWRRRCRTPAGSASSPG